MKKVAFISSWWFQESDQVLSEESVLVLNALYKSAKKYFLINEKVDYYFITNGKTKIEGVINIKVDKNFNNFWHICLMKILSLDYISKNYDYYYVNDYDQIYTAEVNTLMLKNNFVVVNHWGSNIGEIYERFNIPSEIKTGRDNFQDYWVLGNFFGGKNKAVFDLLEYTFDYHSRTYDSEKDFYTVYPEEVFLISYLYNNNIDFTRLNTDVFSINETIFMSTFAEHTFDYISIHKENRYIKLLHDTKRFPNLLKKCYNYI